MLLYYSLQKEKVCYFLRDQTSISAHLILISKLITLNKFTSIDILASLLMMNSAGGQSHVTYACKAVSNNLFLLSQLKHFVDTSKRKLFDHAHISSRLTYASTVWDGWSDIVFQKNLILFIGELQSWCFPIHPQQQKLRCSAWVYSRLERNLCSLRLYSYSIHAEMLLLTN